MIISLLGNQTLHQIWGGSECGLTSMRHRLSIGLPAGSRELPALDKGWDRRTADDIVWRINAKTHGVGTSSRSPAGLRGATVQDIDPASLRLDQ
jgi:hypothetical protein